MTTFPEQVAADLHGTVLNADEFARTVTYTPAGGAGSDVLAIVTPELIESQFLPAVGEADHASAEATILISADASQGVADPAVGDQVTIDSETWAVLAVLEKVTIGSAGWSQIRIRRSRRTRLAEPQHRLSPE